TAAAGAAVTAALATALAAALILRWTLAFRRPRNFRRLPICRGGLGSALGLGAGLPVPRALPILSALPALRVLARLSGRAAGRPGGGERLAEGEAPAKLLGVATVEIHRAAVDLQQPAVGGALEAFGEGRLDLAGGRGEAGDHVLDAGADVVGRE